MGVRRVVVVGGTSGIGLATAQQLAAEGADVLALGRNEKQIDEVKEAHPEVRFALADAASQEAMASCYAAFGPFSGLVLCVSGAKGAGFFKDLEADDVLSGFQQKFIPQFRAAQAALPFLKQDGSITFVSAISARAANPGTAGLAAINGAIEAMIKPLARELKPLRANAVSPGVVETPWWSKVPDAVREQLLQQSAAASLVGKNAQAEELAHAIVFLIGNGFVTGTVLEVDGGLRLS
ncbi:putative oxidoreductase [Acidisarcina polymorpha]|uniref:Putative oxidoreductase n=1 Tax=Acidisarcina polymorpha TaxID=2211140 RepID=A0A2Z5G5M4_9BACT|nr:SDR family oxidoreductase [Acidisarcina polymorpha]AXC13856.1 putative oxidoreductase [Acidisarcina polymorpha]